VLKDTDLRESARQALEALTKQKLGTDPEKWTAWWKGKRLPGRANNFPDPRRCISLRVAKL
jgi:hypothetical protein